MNPTHRSNDDGYPDAITDFPHAFEDVTRLSRRNLLAGALAGLGASTLSSCAALDSIRPGSVPDDERYWDAIAREFMLRDGLTYMNTGTRGPSPKNVYLAQVEAIRLSNEDRLGYAHAVYTAEYKAGLRSRLAAFIGCDADEIAITNNTTEGMAIGTNGPDFAAGDEIIYTNHDHSSGGQPVNLRCARQGLVPVRIDLSERKYHPPRSPDDIVAAFEAAITPRTRLISFCHVNYTDGCVMPVREICELARSKGILTLVDGAHPPGMMQLDVHALGCDMYAGACHKWMMAGQLTGFFYVRRELQDRIWPSIYSGPVQGRNMYGAVDDAARGRTAERYETHGSINYAAGRSIDAALDFHNRIGPAAIEARDRALAARARAALSAIEGVDVFTSADERLCAGLVAFRMRGVTTKTLSDLLWDRHDIYIREVTHPEIDWDVNRMSLHVMVTSAQLENAIAAIGEIARERRHVGRA